LCLYDGRAALQGLSPRHAEKAQRFLAGVSFQTFRENEEKVFAVVRALEVIGEAAARLPQAFRIQYPDAPWTSMAGMRNKLIHACFGIDVAVVWETVTEKLPLIRKSVSLILQQLDRERGPE
jgi:uncharacterized protein with HEPN domain